MRNFLVAAILLVATGLQAQVYSVKGRLIDESDRSPVSGATISIQNLADTGFRRSMVSNPRGAFEFTSIPAGSFKLSSSFIGFETLDTVLTITNASIDLGVIRLQKGAELLGEVVFQAQTPTVRQKNDTLEYGANAYKVNPDATIEDMVKKMPGITIENGTVKAGGEDVRRVTIDGREFFGEDATAALRNLPAEVVDKIQVFDRLSDQSQFTGFDDGNTTKAINVVTRANMRNGQFGRVYAGYGTDDRYSLGGNVTIFNGTRRISLVGLANNINQQNFATEDLLGVTSSPGRRGGGGGGPRGGGGGNFRGGGGGGGFLVGQQGGISKTNSFGINYSDQWGKKVNASGSYFFNNSANTSATDLTRQMFLSKDSSQFYRENSLSNSDNFNHRASMRVEYKIDSNNTLLITPSISFQKNNSFSQESAALNSGIGDMISETFNNFRRNSTAFNFNNGILYRHAFAKRGRTISLNLNTGINNREGLNTQDAISRYYKSGLYDTTMQVSDQETKGYNVSANLSYTEPVGKGQLQFNYNPGFSGNKADQRTRLFDGEADKTGILDSTQSNVYDNTYNTQVGGVSYRLGDRDKMFLVGLSYQYAELSGAQVFPSPSDIRRSFSNLLPNLMISNKISQRSHIRVFYRGSTNAPSIQQLQNVINRNNPLFLSTGNPELDQSYNHRISARYSYTNTAKSSSFFGNIFYEKTAGYIGTASFIAVEDSVLSNTITLNKGSQLSKPMNLDGYWSLRSFLTYGMPLKFMKTNLNLNLGYGFSQMPGMINNVTNLSKNHNYNIGAVLASNISEYIDYTLSYSANFNQVNNSIQPQLNNDYFSQQASAQVNLLSKNGWVFQNALENRMYRGLTDDFNQNFWLWNLSAGKKFLKDQKGELKLTVFDLLKQNQSISRVTTETYIEDTQTRVLQQYFLLTFSYRLRNFGGR